MEISIKQIWVSVQIFTIIAVSLATNHRKQIVFLHNTKHCLGVFMDSLSFVEKQENEETTTEETTVVETETTDETTVETGVTTDDTTAPDVTEEPTTAPDVTTDNSGATTPNGTTANGGATTPNSGNNGSANRPTGGNGGNASQTADFGVVAALVSAISACGVMIAKKRK